MSIHINTPDGYSLAECNEMTISGLPGVGCYTLALNLNFTVTPPEIETHLAGLYLRVEWGDKKQRLLGTAFPDMALPVSLNSGSGNRLRSSFRMDVSPSQIEAIESLRAGQGFALTLWMYGEMSQRNQTLSVNTSSNFPVSQNEWLAVLQNMGYQETLVFEMPVSQISSEHKEVTTIINQARHFLHQGYYDSCVAECRKLLELCKTSPQDQTLLGEARKNYNEKARREQLSIGQRWLLLKDTLALLSHPPHHSGFNHGYSRDQAKLILSSTVAFYTAHSI